MSGVVIALIALGYGAALFWLAFRVEQSKFALSPRWRAIAFGLSLGVYCTSWSFFGAVGTATSRGWEFLPIYLGPALLFLFGGGIVRKLLRAGKAAESTSIADFLSARYGRSRAVAVCVTLIALASAIPYIALQLRGVSLSLTALAGDARPDVDLLAIIITTLALACFAILFGARSADATKGNRGLVYAIAIESIVKITALTAIAFFAFYLLAIHPIAAEAGIGALSAAFSVDGFDDRFWMLTLLAAAAGLCLPRQFHMLVCECEDSDDLEIARKWFPAYLTVFALAVLPITTAGLMLLPTRPAPDQFVIALPLAHGAPWLAALAFLGGVSAATAMVIVASIAISRMVANDLVGPLLFRVQSEPPRHLAAMLLLTRRLTIATLLAIAAIFAWAIPQSTLLADVGLIAFAGVAQFAPLILAALYWERARTAGAIAGLIVGFAVWLALIAAPAMAPAWRQIVDQGLTAIATATAWDPFTIACALALSANCLALFLGSVLAKDTLSERAFARSFVRTDARASLHAWQGLERRARVIDLRDLVARVIGQDGAAEAFQGFAKDKRGAPADGDFVSPDLLAHVERFLSRSLGASTARVLVRRLLSRSPVPNREAEALLEQTARQIQSNRNLLEITFANIPEGISAVDQRQRLLVWNQAYADLFQYPPELLQQGRPIADLIRFNQHSGLWGDQQGDDYVQRRLEHLRHGDVHAYERRRADGRVIRIQGRPLPDGGYVTTFTDVTHYKEIEAALLQSKAALKASNDALETRVAERTAELAKARLAAEAATRTKSRFLAAASHDLLQPLNAAWLFAASLAEHGPRSGEFRETLGKVDASIANANELLRSLLDISKLDAGALKPNLSVFSIQDLLAQVVTQFELLAEKSGLALSFIPCRHFVRSDRGLVLSVIQNFVSNAIRYTPSGRILIGCRRRGEEIELIVADTGPGIAPEQQEMVFEEFKRLQGRQNDGPQGLGLGLAIVRRISDLLGLQVRVRSQVGRGSAFSIRLPVVTEPPCAEIIDLWEKQPRGEFLAPKGLRVLVLDNEPCVLESMAKLLSHWGWAVDCAGTLAEALDKSAGRPPPDAVVFDYRLDHGVTGLAAYRRLCTLWRQRPPGLIISADPDPALPGKVASADLIFLRKPVAPDDLRHALAGMVRPIAAE